MGREGSDAPGLDGKKIKKFKWLHLGSETLYVGAKATDGTKTVNGVWMFDGATLAKVYAEGDSLVLSGTTRAVKSIAEPTGSKTGNTQSRVASLNGKLALLVTCSDGHVEYVRLP